MTSGMISGSSGISPKGHGVIREHALHFIKHLMAHVSFKLNRIDAMGQKYARMDKYSITLYLLIYHL